MDSRVSNLIESFQKNGWRLIGPIDISNDWWFEEIILLRSTWSPIGRELYLTLLTDPQVYNKKTIWSISISSVLPKQNDYGSIEEVSLNDIKKVDLQNIVRRINKMI